MSRNLPLQTPDTPAPRIPARELPGATGRWARLALIALLMAIGLAIAQSVRMGISGSKVARAQAEVDLASGGRRAPTTAEVMAVADRAQTYFAEGLTYEPDNPWALEGLGLLELQRMRLVRTPGEAVAHARNALRRFRDGLRQRPTSPFLWANLALAKLYLDEIDSEFITALSHADQLGPWEPSTQQVVLFAGLAAWQHLDPGLKRSMGAVLERGGLRNSVKMFEIVKGYRRFDLVCPLRSYHLLAAAECRKLTEAAVTHELRDRGMR